MNTTFKELKCPHCGSDTKQGNIEVGIDVVSTKICIDCSETVVVIIPNKDYRYSLDRKLIK